MVELRRVAELRIMPVAAICGHQLPRVRSPFLNATVSQNSDFTGVRRFGALCSPACRFHPHSRIANAPLGRWPLTRSPASGGSQSFVQRLSSWTRTFVQGRFAQPRRSARVVNSSGRSGRRRRSRQSGRASGVTSRHRPARWMACRSPPVGPALPSAPMRSTRARDMAPSVRSSPHTATRTGHSWQMLGKRLHYICLCGAHSAHIQQEWERDRGDEHGPGARRPWLDSEVYFCHRSFSSTLVADVCFALL